MPIDDTQCAIDCDPRKRTCIGQQSLHGAHHGAMHASPSRFLMILPKIFFEFLHVKNRVYKLNMLKNYWLKFLTMKATILDTCVSIKKKMLVNKDIQSDKKRDTNLRKISKQSLFLLIWSTFIQKTLTLNMTTFGIFFK